MAFTSLRCALSDWLKKRKLEKSFKEQKKRDKIISQRKKSISES